MSLKSYQTRFIELAIEVQALKFGSFTLKSGRISPYFFNAGLFHSGKALLELSRCYADAILDSKLSFDLLFGPAYKGIPLAAATVATLYREHHLDYPYAFNRKEAKTHGEGGTLVGADLKGDVLIIDDVITAGTAIREVVSLIQQAQARPVGVVIGVDRCEKGRSEQSAVQEVSNEFGLSVVSIVNVHHIRAYLARDAQNQVLVSRMDSYREQYGI